MLVVALYYTIHGKYLILCENENELYWGCVQYMVRCLSQSDTNINLFSQKLFFEINWFVDSNGAANGSEWFLN